MLYLVFNYSVLSINSLTKTVLSLRNPLTQDSNYDKEHQETPVFAIKPTG